MLNLASQITSCYTSPSEIHTTSVHIMTLILPLLNNNNNMFRMNDPENVQNIRQCTALNIKYVKVCFVSYIRTPIMKILLRQ